MEYTLRVFTSNEKALLSYKSNRQGQTIKNVVNNKLAAVYKKYFDKAVKSYDERAIAGKTIGNYFKAIQNSNIPEVYELSLIVKYDISSQEDKDAIKRIFDAYKKELEKSGYIGIVALNYVTIDEFKEFSLFFVPVTEGYITGLSVRNDLIDLARKLAGIEEKKVDITSGIAIFTDEMDKVFQSVNNGEILSQEEAKKAKETRYISDPTKMHQIEINALKSQMNQLQSITYENQDLETRVEREKQRISNDIIWVKETEPKIIQAEKERIRQEEIEAELAAKEAERQKVLEAQRQEEERLRKEEEAVQKKRFEEQAKRNLEIRKQMEMAAAAAAGPIRIEWGIQDLIKAIAKHKEWETAYGLDTIENASQIPVEALTDPRRLNLENLILSRVAFNKPLRLVGVSIENCELRDCDIRVQLIGTKINKLTMNNASFEQLSMTDCKVGNSDFSDVSISDSTLSHVAVGKCNFTRSKISNVVSVNGTYYLECDFTNAEIAACDCRKTLFKDCILKETTYHECDMRNSVFENCDSQDVINENSNFRGAQKK